VPDHVLAEFAGGADDGDFVDGGHGGSIAGSCDRVTYRRDVWQAGG
jgi:hypothetical protein